MRALFCRFQPWCTIAAAMILALFGIFEVIDQPTMIALLIVLTVILPSIRRRSDGIRDAGA